MIDRERAEFRAKVAYEIAMRKRQSPHSFFVPNVGQERLLNELNGEENPMVLAFLAGNGVGKTTLMVMLMAALAWPDDAHPEWIGKNSWVRKWGPRKPKTRIICQVDDMRENGSLFMEIQKWFPPGRYSMEKDGKNYVSKIVCDTGMVYGVRTFDQSIKSHAGANLDLILVNEPMPAHLHAESIGRLRDSDLAMMIYFLTPLGVSAWMYDQLVEGQDGKDTIVVNASIWDNCREIAGTRGCLKMETIKKLIKEWERLDPDEAHAREHGEFKQLSGRVYKVFNEGIHVVEPFEVPADWEFYRVLDPHDSRAPAVQFWAVSPMNVAYCVAEYPNTRDYAKMGATSLTYDVFVKEIKAIEGKVSKHGEFDDIIDPNKGPTKTRHNNLSILDEYNNRGFKFRVADSDDLDAGHKRVQQMLYYDKEKEVDEFNSPRMYFFSSCRNSISAMRKYSWKSDSTGSATNRIDQTYKDFADCTRYFAVSMRPWQGRTKGGSLSRLVNKRRGRK